MSKRSCCSLGKRALMFVLCGVMAYSIVFTVAVYAIVMFGLSGWYIAMVPFWSLLGIGFSPALISLCRDSFTSVQARGRAKLRTTIIGITVFCVLFTMSISQDYFFGILHFGFVVHNVISLFGCAVAIIVGRRLSFGCH